MISMANRDTEVGQLPDWAVGLIMILFGAILFWTFILGPAISAFISWLQQNWILVFVIICVALIIAGVFLDKRKKWNEEERKREEEEIKKNEEDEKKREEEKRKFEEGQKAKGLEKFIDEETKKEIWGTRQEVQKWKRAFEKAREEAKPFNKAIKAIKEFEPARKYKNEFPYQTDLRGWLKSQFPNTEIEIQKGSERPDIVIGDIAIEIKGPTDSSALKSIADKAVRYLQHYKYFIVVLFEVEVNESHYEIWLKGMNKSFPEVTIIRK
jgi:hypothetical protein